MSTVTTTMKKAPGHRVLIKPTEIETKSKGGIVLVQDERQARVNTDTGTVISIGPTAWMAYDYYKPDGTRNPLWAPWCVVGEKIYYSKYGAKWMIIQDEHYVLINDQDVCLSVDEEAEDAQGN